jgi:hypothetical protein
MDLDAVLIFKTIKIPTLKFKLLDLNQTVQILLISRRHGF